MVVTLYNMVTIPFSISFYLTNTHPMLKIDEYANIAFLLDVLMTFNTSYYCKGMIVQSRKKIAVHYLKSWFFIDLVSSLPYELMVESSDDESTWETVRLLRLLRITKLTRLLRLFKLNIYVSKMKENFEITNAVSGAFGVCKLVFLILTLAHFLACFWHLIGESASDTEGSWLTARGIENESIRVRYISALYWAVTTMITVGYGDISPTNPDEQLFGIFCMIIGCGMFAYSMNQIGQIIREIEGNLSESK